MTQVTSTTNSFGLTELLALCEVPRDSCPNWFSNPITESTPTNQGGVLTMSSQRSRRALLTMPVDKLRLSMWICLVLRADGIELVGQLISRSTGELAALECMTDDGVSEIEARLAQVGRRLRDRRLGPQSARDSRSNLFRQLPRKQVRRLLAAGIASDSLLLDLDDVELTRYLQRDAGRFKKSLISQGLMLRSPPRRKYPQSCMQSPCFGFCGNNCGESTRMRRKPNLNIQYPSHDYASA